MGVTPEENAAAQPATTVCYRHPRRETGVSCVRCGRPICPDCMRPAAVGFQCPECVAGGRREVRETRTVLGGRVAGRPAQLTYLLIAANIVAYIVQRGSSTVTGNYEMWPRAVAHGEYYRLVTSAFLHDPRSILHIAFNMWALFLVGPQVEALLGKTRFLFLYLASAVGGSLVVYVVAPVDSFALGASGAVFGLFGALLVLARRFSRDIGGIGFVIGLNLVLSFTLPNISWQGHVGGLVTGTLLALGYAYAPRHWRMALGYALPAVVAAVFAFVVVVRTTAITG